MRPVTVARQQGEEMVIANGLAAGEEVVTDGQLRLTPGARIVRASEGARGRGTRAATAAGTTGNGEQ
jgi:multidrug efflux system membrane fusion protein